MTWTWTAGLAISRWWLAPAMLSIMVLVAMGVVVGYHRVLTHRSAVLARPLELLLVLFGLGAGTPVQWIGNHRFHHAHTDEPEDVHSPMHHGFWVAHCGWYLETSSTVLSMLYACAGPLRTVFDAWWRPRSNQQHISLAPDIAADPVFAWLSNPWPYALALLGSMMLVWSGFILAWGAVGSLAMTFIHVAAYTFGDLVNSAGHMIEQPYTDRDRSRDQGWLALLSFGDGWHNAHHAHPRSIRAGLKPGQWDPAYWFVLACSKVGLARDLRIATPSKEQPWRP
jgi:fatty-acid desaturase